MKPKIGVKFLAFLKRLLGYKQPHLPANNESKQPLAKHLLSMSAYEDRPNPHWNRQQPAGILYRQAHGITDEDNHVPASAAIMITPDEAIMCLRGYGLDEILTPEDDATLWAAIISAYWPTPHDGKVSIQGLRFGVGTFDPEAKFKLQPIAGCCFERVDEKSLKTTVCHDKELDTQLDKKLKVLPGITLFMLPFLGLSDGQPTYPYMAIVIERPSIAKQEVIVYNGAQLGHNAGMGQTGVYNRIVGGWQESGRILNHWQS